MVVLNHENNEACHTAIIQVHIIGDLSATRTGMPATRQDPALFELQLQTALPFAS